MTSSNTGNTSLFPLPQPLHWHLGPDCPSFPDGLLSIHKGLWALTSPLSSHRSSLLKVLASLLEEKLPCVLHSFLPSASHLSSAPAFQGERCAFMGEQGPERVQHEYQPLFEPDGLQVCMNSPSQGTVGESPWLQAAWRTWCLLCCLFLPVKERALQRNQPWQHAWLTRKVMREAYLQVGEHPLQLSSCPSGLISLPEAPFQGEGALLNPKRVLSGLLVGCVTFPSPWGAASPIVKDFDDYSKKLEQLHSRLWRRETEYMGGGVRGGLPLSFCSLPRTLKPEGKVIIIDDNTSNPCRLRRGARLQSLELPCVSSYPVA